MRVYNPSPHPRPRYPSARVGERVRHAQEAISVLEPGFGVACVFDECDVLGDSSFAVVVSDDERSANLCGDRAE